jgi:hypothetical protein
MKLSSHVRLLHSRSIFLVRLKLQWVGADPDQLVVRKGHTHICIEGFPRSANTFAFAFFALANPEEEEHIAHHTHSIANVARALRYDIPVIALIREPVQAILSAYIFGPRDLDYQVRSYIAFYEWLEPRKNKVVVADFDLAIRNFSQVIGQVNSKYGLSFRKAEDLAEMERQVRENLQDPAFYSKVGRGWAKTKSIGRQRLPSPERDKLKDKLQGEVLAHTQIDAARTVYHETISQATKQPGSTV